MTKRQKEAVVVITVAVFVLVSAIHLLVGSHDYSSIRASLDGENISFNIPQVLVDQITFTLIALLVSWLAITRGVNLMARVTIVLIAGILLLLAWWLLYSLEPATLLRQIINLGISLRFILYCLSWACGLTLIVGSVTYFIRHRYFGPPS